MRFWSWYISMMRSLLPPALLPAQGAGLIVASGTDPRLSVRRRGGMIPLGTLHRLTADQLATARIAARQGVTIRLQDARCVLQRTATLPLATERDLPTAIGHEMDALTPFDADEVYVRIDPLRRDREQGTIRLNLAILPRAVIAPVVESLARAGLAASRIEATLPDRHLVFRIGGNPGQGRAGLRAPAILCAVLLLVCIAIPVIRQQRALAALGLQQQTIAAPLHTAASLRRRLTTARTGNAALATERRREGDALAALAALTTTLPDGSFLTDASLRHNVAALDGESPDAAGLLARLSADPHFAAPEFTAPVTRALNARADIFALKVRLRDGHR